MYELFLDGIQMPVAPSNITVKIKNKNETINLINGLEINILKTGGLFDCNFDLLIPSAKYPFAVYPDGFKPVHFYIDKFENWKAEKKPIRFVILRNMPSGKILHETNSLVSLEEYSIKDDSKEGFDVVISVKLKQFKEYKTDVKIYEEIKKGSGKIKKVSTAAKNIVSKLKAKDKGKNGKYKTYKVAQGDTLWIIAKRRYGNGDMYKKIYELNRDSITNPNVIRVGQVLKMP